MHPALAMCSFLSKIKRSFPKLRNHDGDFYDNEEINESITEMFIDIRRLMKGYEELEKSMKEKVESLLESTNCKRATDIRRLLKGYEESEEFMKKTVEALLESTNRKRGTDWVFASELTEDTKTSETDECPTTDNYTELTEDTKTPETDDCPTTVNYKDEDLVILEVRTVVDSTKEIATDLTKSIKRKRGTDRTMASEQIVETDGSQMTTKNVEDRITKTKKVRYDTEGCVTDKDPLNVEDRRVEVIDLWDEREAVNNRVPDPVLESETKPRNQVGLTREEIYLMFDDSEDEDEGFDEDEDEVELMKSEEDVEVTEKTPKIESLSKDWDGWDEKEQHGEVLGPWRCDGTVKCQASERGSFGEIKLDCREAKAERDFLKSGQIERRAAEVNLLTSSNMRVIKEIKKDIM